MRWAGHVGRVGEERKVYKVLVGKPEGKRPLGELRSKLKDGIRMGVWSGLNWLRIGTCDGLL
jgi:hypothetical protein